MGILLIGLNHRTAPVEVREQLAFSRDGVATALILFRNQFSNSEAAILSTCNRVEMIVAADGAEHPNVNDVVSFIAQARDLPVASFRSHLYQLTDEHAMRHFFRVAGGLDSMVLGEYQIVNQMKQAYAQASEQGTTGRVLNRLFHHAFEVSKRIRSETEIGAGKTSIPSVAVDVAQRIFSDFTNKHVLVVGAGEMAQLTCQYLREANATKFTVTTRTLLNAKALAEACQGEAVPFDQLDEQLVQADIVITATSCPTVLLGVERVQAAQKKRRGKLLFIIDLAVPRNVDPDVSKLDQVFVYDVDALGKMVEENQQHRVGQLQACDQILDESLDGFVKWLGEAKLQPLIERMFADARELKSAELQRLYNRCPELSEEQRKAVEQLAERVIGKFMHPCVSTMRRHSLSGPSTTLAEMFHDITVKQRRGE